MPAPQTPIDPELARTYFREWMQRMNLSIRTAAPVLGVGTTTVAGWSRGATAIPRVVVLACAALEHHGDTAAAALRAVDPNPAPLPEPPPPPEPKRTGYRAKNLQMADELDAVRAKFELDPPAKRAAFKQGMRERRFTWEMLTIEEREDIDIWDSLTIPDVRRRRLQDGLPVMGDIRPDMPTLIPDKFPLWRYPLVQAGIDPDTATKTDPKVQEVLVAFLNDHYRRAPEPKTPRPSDHHFWWFDPKASFLGMGWAWVTYASVPYVKPPFGLQQEMTSDEIKARVMAMFGPDFDD